MNLMHFTEGPAAPEEQPTLPLPEDCRSLREFYPDPWQRDRLHYVFAHYFLPSHLLRNPAELRAAFCGGRPGGPWRKPCDPIRLIQAGWCRMEQEAGLGPTAAPLQELRGRPLRRVLDLEAWVEPVAGKFALFVEMPRPETPPGGLSAGPLAFFTGVVCLSDSEARYFTLERMRTEGEDLFCKEGVLCEWTVDKTHVNHGRLVDPQRASFVAAVAEAVERGESPRPEMSERAKPEASGSGSEADQTRRPSGEEILPLRMGCITEGWCWDLWIEISSRPLTVVFHDYALAIPAEGRQTTSVVCSNCGKSVQVDVRSTPEVGRYRWTMFGLALAVPMVLAAMVKLLAHRYWQNDAQLAQMLIVLFLLGFFLEGGVILRLLAPSDYIRFGVRTRGHTRIRYSDEGEPGIGLDCDTPEPVACLDCGSTIPRDLTQCPKCGWSYVDRSA